MPGGPGAPELDHVEQMLLGEPVEGLLGQGPHRGQGAVAGDQLFLHVHPLKEHGGVGVGDGGQGLGGGLLQLPNLPLCCFVVP